MSFRWLCSFYDQSFSYTVATLSSLHLHNAQVLCSVHIFNFIAFVFFHRDINHTTSDNSLNNTPLQNNLVTLKCDFFNNKDTEESRHPAEDHPIHSKEIVTGTRHFKVLFYESPIGRCLCQCCVLNVLHILDEVSLQVNAFNRFQHLLQRQVYEIILVSMLLR